MNRGVAGGDGQPCVVCTLLSLMRPFLHRHSEFDQEVLCKQVTALREDDELQPIIRLFDEDEVPQRGVEDYVLLAFLDEGILESLHYRRDDDGGYDSGGTSDV